MYSPFADPMEDESLSEVEVNVAKAALGMRDHSVKDCMKNMEEVYTVNDGMRVCDVDLKEVRTRLVLSVRSTN